MVSGAAARLAAGSPAIAAAHFRAEADPYHPSANPSGHVNLGTAENRLVFDLLAARLTAGRPRTAGEVHYAPLHGTRALRAAVAGLLAGTWHRPVSAEDLVVVSGATAALDIAASVLCDPGEAIAVPAPYYSALDTDLAGRSGAVLVPVPMPGPGGSALDAAELDRALGRLRRAGTVVRAVAVTSPANPQGQVYGAPVLRDLLRVAAENDIDVIADEIYAHSVFGPRPFASVRDPAVLGAVPAADPDRVHVVWGFAKDFGLSGLKVGVLHTTGAATRAAARALAYFAPASTDTQALLADLLADRHWLAAFQAAATARLAASARATGDLLDRLGIGYLPPQGGFSFWLDLRPWLAAPDFAAEHALWQRIGAARLNILPGAVFGAGEPGWFRLCHAVDRTLVREGIARLAAVLAGSATNPATPVPGPGPMAATARAATPARAATLVSGPEATPGRAATLVSSRAATPGRATTLVSGPDATPGRATIPTPAATVPPGPA
jgi:1-aminocyclopropane-1-carboxylate synthase 1/2/6